MRLRSLMLLVAVLGAAAAGPASRPVDLAARQKKEFDDRIKSMRVEADPVDIGSLFTIRPGEQEGAIRLRLLPGANRLRNRAFRIAGLDLAFGAFNVYSNAGQVVSCTFSLTRFDDPAAVEVNTNFNWTPSFIAINRQLRYADGRFRRINVSWQSYHQFETERVVSVNVMEQTPNRGYQMIYQFQTSSLQDARRLHPDRFNADIFPILIDLRLMPLLSVDSLFFWQVYREDFKPPTQLVEQVRAAIDRFKSEQFHEREAAMGQLRQLSREAVLVATSIDRATLTAQQLALVDAYASEFALLGDDEARRRRGDVAFLVDCLYSDDPAVRTASLTRIERTTGQKYEFDPGKDPMLQSTVIEAIRKTIGKPR